MMHELVVRFGLDNTLLNNDRVQADLDTHSLNSQAARI